MLEAWELIAIILGSSVVTAAVTGYIQIRLWKLNRKAKKEDEETAGEKHIKKAVQVILYDRIKYLGRHHIGQEYISAEDLEDLMIMHQVYHDDLDGNGFLDNVMKQVKNLQIRK